MIHDEVDDPLLPFRELPQHCDMIILNTCSYVKKILYNDWARWECPIYLILPSAHQANLIESNVDRILHHMHFGKLALKGGTDINACLIGMVSF
jgi:hypothetical protein